MRCHLIRRVLSCAAFGVFGLFGQAQADVIDFESLPPDSLFLSGDTFTQNLYYRFTQQGNFGAVSTAAGFAVALPPTGNDTQFYGALNDSSLAVRRSDGIPFSISGFDAAYLAPVPQDEGTIAGRIFLVGTDTLGHTLFNTWEFGAAAADGSFAFQTYSTGFSLFNNLTSAFFAACIYGQDGACSNPFENSAQFALDNLIIAVPEPSTYGLLALGLLSVGLYSRRARR